MIGSRKDDCSRGFIAPMVATALMILAFRALPAQNLGSATHSRTLVELSRCQSAVDMACFRVRGEYVGGALDSAETFHARLDQADLLGPGTIVPFGTSRLRLLVLFDVSGSMLKDNAIAITRVPLRSFLTALPDWVSVAVVPFESRDVTQAFREAQFVPAPMIGEQLKRLPTPRVNGNTALYSSILLGLRLLDSLPQLGRSVLVVITDGSNDVGHKGDEPGLLDSISGGRDRVRLEIARSRNQVWLVGTGTGVRVDELRFLAGNASSARTVPMDPLALGREFQRIRAELLPARAMVYGVSAAGKSDLGRRSRILHISGLLDSAIRWHPPLVALPTYQSTVHSRGTADSLWLSEDVRRQVAAADSEASSRLLVGGPLLAMLLLLYVVVPRALTPPAAAGRVEGEEEGQRKRPSKPALSTAPSPSMRLAVEAPPRSPADITKDAAA